MAHTEQGRDSPDPGGNKNGVIAFVAPRVLSPARQYGLRFPLRAAANFLAGKRLKQKEIWTLFKVRS